MREVACTTAWWRYFLPFDARMRCLNFSCWCSGTQLKAIVQSMCCGAAGAGACAVIWEGWDEVMEVVIMDCPDGNTRVTVAGVVLLAWGLDICSEGCLLKGQMVR